MVVDCRIAERYRQMHEREGQFPDTMNADADATRANARHLSPVRAGGPALALRFEGSLRVQGGETRRAGLAMLAFWRGPVRCLAQCAKCKATRKCCRHYCPIRGQIREKSSARFLTAFEGIEKRLEE